MSPEEWGYLLVLLASLPGGFFIKTLEGQSLRCAVPALLGAGLALLLCGVNSLHSVVVTAGTCLIVHATHRHCHMLTLLWTFSYLAFFRTCHLLGLPSPPAYANAMQLILTLKLVSLANEVRDLSLLQKVEDKAVGRPSTVLALRRMPTIWEMWCYCYCYVGLLTGPFYRFRTFDDWVNQPHSVSIPTWRPLLQRVRYAPVFGVLFLISARFFPANAALSDEFYESGFAFRLFYMVPVFFAFRMRFYVCWLLAEAGCIAAALGAYPKRARAKPGAGPIMELESTSSEAEGPVEYDFDTIKNIDCYSADFCVRVKDGMRYWNMSVQWWLAQYIYKTAPFRPYILRSVWTMLVSAFWHGIHPGYYLSFLTIPLCLAAENAMEKAVRDRLPTHRRAAFDWVHWFLKMRAYDYMCMGFVLLSLQDTLRYWHSIAFVMHVVPSACAVFAWLLLAWRGSSRKA
uniref:lysophospholipid acyltransferase 7-like isoform X2 n=1 Tax=Myxine glutinosa TaxID=7769 RepID=UPI00358F2DDA